MREVVVEIIRETFSGIYLFLDQKRIKNLHNNEYGYNFTYGQRM